jgi:hypothetical protein
VKNKETVRIETKRMRRRRLRSFHLVAAREEVVASIWLQPEKIGW